MAINFEKYGSGIPLVLFHGWGFDKNIWKPLVPYLINNFQLYLIDLPGFGETPCMQWEIFKEELLKLIPKKFIVLGWSLGGLFATRLAIESPDRVLKFINVASSPKFIRDYDWIGIDVPILNDFHNRFTQDPYKTRSAFINSQSLADNNYKIELSDTLNITGLNNGLDILLNWDLRTQLLDVKTPGLFVFGRLDGIVSARLMPTLQRLYPWFNYELFKKSAHIPFISHLNDFVKSIVFFCDK